MTDNEKTSAADNEIIKALNRWTNNFEGKVTELAILCNALDLITRQKAEIEKLKEQDVTAEKIIREQGGTILTLKDENSRLFDKNCELSEKGEKAVIACIAARKEAVKECLDKIEQMDVSESDNYIMVKKNKFDNLVKEMVGDTE